MNYWRLLKHYKRRLAQGVVVCTKKSYNKECSEVRVNARNAIQRAIEPTAIGNQRDSSTPSTHTNALG